MEDHSPVVLDGVHTILPWKLTVLSGKPGSVRGAVKLPERMEAVKLKVERMPFKSET